MNGRNDINAPFRQPKEIKAININTGEETIAKNTGDFIGTLISCKRKRLKEDIEALDKYHDGIVNKYEVYALIDQILI